MRVVRFIFNISRTHMQKEQVFQFRGCTSRPNVVYQVQKVDVEEIGEEEEEEEEEDVLGLKKGRRGFERVVEKAVLALVVSKLE